MVPKLRLAVLKDAPIKHRREESVFDMVQGGRLANMKDVQI